MKNCELYARQLLKRLTLREKVAQLSQTVAGYRGFCRKGEDFFFQPAFYSFLEEYGAMGAISNLLRADPFAVESFAEGIEPRHRVKVANQLQREVLDRARVPIPVLIEVEANHGVMALGSEVFPTNLGLGCMFHDELYGKIMASVGKEIALSANHMGFTAMLDVARDPRWGRTEECLSEDPYLIGRYAKSGVKGFKTANALLCCKHFCAAGDSYGGLNTAEVNVGRRELHDIHLTGAKNAIRAGADVVMAAYNTVDGVPCHMNKYLLRDVLREELGFRGILLSDGWGVARAIEQMGLDEETGAATVLRAGIDLSLADHGAFLHLIGACEKGILEEELIDEAVLRILEKKYELGLFDDPFVKDDGSLVAYQQSGVQQKLAYEAACESAVLLKNNGILPLSPHKRVALFGAHAANIYYLLGDYTSLQNTQTCVTLLEALRERFDALQYTRGWDFEGDDGDMQHALELARDCDVAVVTVGGSSARALAEAKYDSHTGAAAGSKTFLDCGEGCDVADLRLPGNQTALIRRLKAEGIPVVLVMIAGRPYEITEENELADAVLAAWYPGLQGGRAIGDILTGRVNPSGKLSVSIPVSSACLPVYYNRYERTKREVKRKAYNRTYLDHLHPVLYPFGYGLSYASFSYSDLPLERLGKNRFQVSAAVKNESAVAGTEVVQLYISGSGNSVRRRAKELRGYERVYLLPGETKRVSFTLGSEELCVYSIREKWEVENARVTVMIGSNPELRLMAELTTEAEDAAYTPISTES